MFGGGFISKRNADPKKKKKAIGFIYLFSRFFISVDISQKIIYWRESTSLSLRSMLFVKKAKTTK